jgi:phosphatidylglycerophosphatase A
MDLRQKTVMFFATGAYFGKIKFAPGTFGTIPGLFLCFLLSKTGLYAATLCTILLIVFATWVAENAEAILKEKDPESVVIDEIAGIAVTLLGHPFTIPYVVAGFFIFRFFDILKPFPIRYLEREIKGGAGVVLDDVLAGCAGSIVLFLMGYLL